ncbi:hypothetical protein BDN71DRAFT_1458381 [Pleurotus eryngii]|uniref:Uncharacterized protein n=1 Tax=Pleurotus eryngii TaxID=5323 RepID=A0A9P6D1M1_PLEER|nr:hypothetical protein BDN71DRAFT_1458381 [Pleurotus eryngii]
MNPHPIQMIGLHELEIDNVDSFDMSSIDTPSLLSLSVLHRVENLVPQKCPPNITKLILKLSHNPSWTDAIASSLRRLTQLETLTLEARDWGSSNYTDYLVLRMPQAPHGRLPASASRDTVTRPCLFPRTVIVRLLPPRWLP